MKHNTLKKVLSLLLVICTMASFAGCIPGVEDPTEPSTIVTTGPTESTAGPTDGTTAPTDSTDATTSPTEETQAPTEPTEAETEPPATEAPNTDPTFATEVPTESPVETFVDVVETVYAISTVNVRSGPSTDDMIVGSLSYGESVQRTGIGNKGWSRVEYKGEEAYVYASYLSTTNPAQDTSGYPKTYSDATCDITITKEWYAAFHNESHHPHCHIVAYSVGKKPYMSQQDLMKLKESFAHEIFKQDLLTTYQEQTSQRNLLKKENTDLIRSIIRSINTGTYENVHLESMLRELSAQLQQAKGKKVYGYLSQPARNLVNNIVDELAKDDRLSQLYSLWYDQRDAVIRTYQDKMPDRLPLSQSETFRSIKNTVIQEAMNLSADTPAMDTAVDLPEEPAEEIPASSSSVEPEVFTPPAHTDNEPGDEIPPQEEPVPPPKPPQHQTNLWTDAYKQARKFLYGTKEEPPQLEKAYELLLTEAKVGNGLAMHDLGKMLLTGIGCEKNEVLAQSWFLQAHDAFLQMEKTDKRPYYWQYRLGKMYSYGYGVEQNYTASAEWFTKAVEGKSPFAAYALGGQFYRGQGVEQDFSQAFSLFSIAATDTSKPNAYAQYQLGRMCKEGLGTTADHFASEQWYRQAYQGFLQMEQDMADDKLYYRLGSMNLSGTGTDVDLIQAMLYFEKAAELGNVDALYGLGKLYLRKDFEGYDPTKATEYLEEAAKQGHSYAQYLLGKLFLRGDDIPQNLEAAIQWLEKSAEQDNQYAQYLLGKILIHGNGVEADPKRALELLERSIEHGNLYAAYFLGKACLQ